MRAGALAVHNGAAGGPGRPGGVHHQIGAALVGDGQNQLVVKIQLRGIFGRLFAAEISQGLSSSHTFHGYRNGDALPRHPQKQLALQLPDQLPGFFRAGNVQNDALEVVLDAQQIHHAAGGGAAAVGRDAHGHPQLLAELRHSVQRVRMDDRNDVIHRFTPKVRRYRRRRIQARAARQACGGRRARPSSGWKSAASWQPAPPRRKRPAAHCRPAPRWHPS